MNSYSNLSEKEVEEKVINHLLELNYQRNNLTTTKDLIKNFEDKLFALNKKVGNLSDEDRYSDWFEQVLSKLQKETENSCIDRAKLIRNEILINIGGTTKHILFISKNAVDNTFEVVNQIRLKGKDVNNRYDINILVNGIPLVQFELKKNSVDLANAFTQTKDYIKTIDDLSARSDFFLFKYTSLFLISNTTFTKYFARGISNFDFANSYTDVNNNLINDLDSFIPTFLKQDFLLDMLTKYTIISSDGLKVMRPYQIHAASAILNKVESYINKDLSNLSTEQNGYIWHTTGSGKTLTSYRASSLIATQFVDEIFRVIFVVDRLDLNKQAVSDYNSFEEECVDGAKNINHLCNLLKENNQKKLIVTTIQKLGRLVSTKDNKYMQELESIRHKRHIFIFDECHRSQFGETHPKIKNFFPNHQLFGFTGTPIFDENAVNKSLNTQRLFGELLHSYNILDGIKNRNVLGFNISYYNTIKSANKTYSTQEIFESHESDEEVSGIDTEEVFENSERIDLIVHEIINRHDTFTQNRYFNAILATGSVPLLLKYVDSFNRIQYEYAQKDKDFKRLKIAAIFTPSKNFYKELTAGQGDALDNVGSSSISETDAENNIQEIIVKFNQDFNTNISSFSSYFDAISNMVNTKDYSKKVHNKDNKSFIDILIVVNMFLTGYDASRLNTIYIDKNLKYHNLIQAISRTNRIDNIKKTFGNVVCFRNLKANINSAMSLFADKDHGNKEILDKIIMPSYESVKNDLTVKVNGILDILKNPSDVMHELITDLDKQKFVMSFIDLMKILSDIKQYVEYHNDNVFKFLDFDYESYKAAFIEIKRDLDRSLDKKEKSSILDDIDFKLEFLFSEKINAEYILKLMSQYTKTHDKKAKDRVTKDLNDKLNELLVTSSQDEHLYSKSYLLEKFLKDNILNSENYIDIDEEQIKSDFDTYCQSKKTAALNDFCDKFEIKENELLRLISRIMHDKEASYEIIASDSPFTKKEISLLKRKAFFSQVETELNALIKNYYALVVNEEI